MKLHFPSMKKMDPTNFTSYEQWCYILLSFNFIKLAFNIILEYQ